MTSQLAFLQKLQLWRRKGKCGRFLLPFMSLGNTNSSRSNKIENFSLCLFALSLSQYYYYYCTKARHP